MYAKQPCAWYQYRLHENDWESETGIEDPVQYFPPDISVDSTGSVFCFGFASREQFSFQNGEMLKQFFGEFVSEFPPPYQIVFNFADVDYLTSDEVGIIAAISQAFADTGSEIVFCELRPQLVELFTLFNLTCTVQVVPTQDEAIACLQS